MSEPRPPWWLLAVATVTVATAKLLLVKLRATTVLVVLAGNRSGGPRKLDADMAARSVAMAGRLLHADCLPQAVALAALLQRAGAAPTLVLGCRFYGPNRWGAHAWVEAGGNRFDSLAEGEHAELARLTSSSRWELRPAAPGSASGSGFTPAERSMPGSDDDADGDPV